MSLLRRPEPWLITLLFAVPFSLATLTYLSGWAPSMLGQTDNPERTLVDPAQPLQLYSLGADGERLRNRWALIYANTGPCDQACASHLIRLLAVHISLGRHGERVKWVYLNVPPAGATGAGDPGVPELPDDRELIVLTAEGAQRDVLHGLIEAASLQSGRVLFVDPRGNLVAIYPAEPTQRSLLRDMRRLLDTSRSG
jgi:hypothetical protein